MYSYEDRIRTVRLYIKIGKRPAATIRQLGFPTKNALKAWYREYERDRDVREGYARTMHKYTPNKGWWPSSISWTTAAVLLQR